MIGLLAGIRANVSTLVSRLTSTRATNLDNLDAAVTTRAPSATALSSSTWSTGRAAALDHTGIKRVYLFEHDCGSYTGGWVTETVTLGTAVDKARTFWVGGLTQQNSSLTVPWSWSGRLQSSTSLDLYLYQIGTDTPSGSVDVKVQVQLVEFN